MKLAAIAFAAAVTASAGAATSFTQNDTFSFPLSPGSQNVSFDAFRSIAGWNSDWQLQSVELNFDITISGDVTAENDSALNAPDFGLTLNGSATVQFDSLFGFAAINSVAASGPLSATDGVDGSGSDFFDFGTVSDSFFGSDSAVGSPAVDPFDVAGTIDAVINANAAFGFTGTTDATLIVSNLAASGNLEVIYNYVVVPAPGTAMTMGVVGLAALRRRR